MKPKTGDKRPTTQKGGLSGKSSVQQKPHFKGKKERTQRNPRKDKSSGKDVKFVVNPKQLQHQINEAKKQELREAFKKQKEEKAKKFNDFQKRKLERNKILGQKTKRGQPVMKGRMEMLLNQIQYKISKE